MQTSKYYFIMLASISLWMAACTKPASNLEIPLPEAHLLGEPEQSYQMNAAPVSPLTVQVGVTTVANEDRTVTVAITSPSGAIAGTHYTINGLGANQTLTIPANEAIAEFSITGDFDEYNAGRKDTLLIVIKDPGMPVAYYADTIKVYLRGPCFDGDINDGVLNSMLGVYNNTFDAGFANWGPYQSRVVSITPLTATTARVVINNVWDYGLGDIPFVLDWSDPLNVFIDVENTMVLPGDAGILNDNYAGMNLVIRKPTVATTVSNLFSACNQRINLRYQFGVYDPAANAILGFFGTVGSTQLRR